MYRHSFEGITIRVAGLFSTGPGGRRDWMRYHADQVTCPRYHTRTLSCSGNLLWHNKDKLELKCDICKAVYTITPKLLTRPKTSKHEGRAGRAVRTVD